MAILMGCTRNSQTRADLLGPDFLVMHPLDFLEHVELPKTSSDLGKPLNKLLMHKVLHQSMHRKNLQTEHSKAVFLIVIP